MSEPEEGSVVTQEPPRIHIWLMKKGDRGVGAMRTWKKRFFTNEAHMEEVSYHKTPDVEKQGSFDLRQVREVTVGFSEGEPEIRVLMGHQGGRVYLLRPLKGADNDLEKAVRLFQQWVSYVRQTPLPAAPHARNSVTSMGGSGAGSSPPSSSSSLPPLSQLSLSNVNNNNVVSSSSASASMGGSFSSSSGSLPPVSGQKESPRRGMLSSARERFGTLMRVGGKQEGGPGSRHTLSGWMTFSLLESLQPSMRLHFVLHELFLVGYADEQCTEVVERTQLQQITQISDMGEQKFCICVQGETESTFQYFRCDSHSEHSLWSGTLKKVCPVDDPSSNPGFSSSSSVSGSGSGGGGGGQPAGMRLTGGPASLLSLAFRSSGNYPGPEDDVESEIEKPEFGSYDLQWDVADEVDMSASGRTLPITPPPGSSGAGGGGGGAVGFLDFVEPEATTAKATTTKSGGGGAVGFLDFIEPSSPAPAKSPRRPLPPKPPMKKPLPQSPREEARVSSSGSSSSDEEEQDSEDASTPVKQIISIPLGPSPNKSSKAPLSSTRPVPPPPSSK